MLRLLRGTSGKDATSAPKRATGMILPRGNRALPAGTFGSLAAARATAASCQKRLPRVTATRLE
eukprot:5853335-Lingulodinium_polyedra.AAC.1